MRHLTLGVSFVKKIPFLALVSVCVLECQPSSVGGHAPTIHTHCFAALQSWIRTPQMCGKAQHSHHDSEGFLSAFSCFCFNRPVPTGYCNHAPTLALTLIIIALVEISKSWVMIGPPKIIRYLFNRRPELGLSVRAVSCRKRSTETVTTVT